MPPEIPTSNDRLLPCPFCGHQPELNTATNSPHWYIVQCVNLNCDPIPEVQAEGRQEAIDAWNRRPTSAHETSCSPEAISAAYEAMPIDRKEIIPLGCTLCPDVVIMPAANGMCDIRKAEGWVWSITSGWRCPACAVKASAQYPHTCGVCGNPEGTHLKSCHHYQRCPLHDCLEPDGHCYCPMPVMDHPFEAACGCQLCRNKLDEYNAENGTVKP